jgi:hypothetical protein
VVHCVPVEEKYEACRMVCKKVEKEVPVCDSCCEPCCKPKKSFGHKSCSSCCN